MAENTKIEWTNRTWSPWEGCTKVSPGCENCYAAGMNRWLHKGENWGPGAPRLEFSDAHWDKLNRWNDAAAKKGEHPKVFPSMCDPLDNEVHAGLRDRFWRAIENTPSLTWLVLTKRIGNAQKMLPQAWLKNAWPKNLWLGATVVNQEEADRDIPKLLAVPARVRFLSIEPMLGPVDLTSIPMRDTCASECCGNWWLDALKGASYCGKVERDPRGETDEAESRIDWVICGGESGHGARPIHPDWARSLRDQCSAAGVPFLFKQWGEWVPYEESAQPPYFHSQNGREIDAHALPDFESEDGQMQREWHSDFADQILARRVGKKAAGRLLDGVEHNGFPTPNDHA